MPEIAERQIKLTQTLAVQVKFNVPGYDLIESELSNSSGIPSIVWMNYNAERYGSINQFVHRVNQIFNSIQNSDVNSVYFLELCSPSSGKLS